MSWSTATMRMALQRVHASERAGAAKGLQLGLEHVLGVARSRVPIEEGTLERSGTTSIDDDRLVGAVSFDTPYAVVQHEDMTMSHDAGREAKYLETAIVGERDTVIELVGASIRDGLGT